MGIVVDPDVDRLAFIDEHGVMFGEEYTLVAIADYVLQHTPAIPFQILFIAALSDITAKHGQKYTAAAVGEVNVVEMMKNQCCYRWRGQRRNYLSTATLWAML